MKYLEKVIQKKVICNNQVATADYNGEEVVKSLFKKYYQNPRLLPEKVLRRIFIETLRVDDISIADSAINLYDCSVKTANDEIREWIGSDLSSTNENRRNENKAFVKRRILCRAITDYIAGMTDGFALSQYSKLL